MVVGSLVVVMVVVTSNVVLARRAFLDAEEDGGDGDMGPQAEAPVATPSLERLASLVEIVQAGAEEGQDQEYEDDEDDGEGEG